MKTPLERLKKAFVSLNFEEKRGFVLSLLEDLKEDDRLFYDIHCLVSSNFAIEQDLYDVFDSLMLALWRREKSGQETALASLLLVKSFRLILVKPTFSTTPPNIIFWIKPP